MSMVNQAGDEIMEEVIFLPSMFEHGEVEAALLLLAEHLGMRFVRTNATKHGNVELQLRPENDSIADEDEDPDEL